MLSGECRRWTTHNPHRIYLIHSSSTFKFKIHRLAISFQKPRRREFPGMHVRPSPLNIFISLSKVPTIELLSKLHKTGYKLFWRKKTLPDRLRCSQGTFFAKCKSKKTHKEVAAGNHGRRRSWTLPPPLGRPRPLSIAAFS